MLVAVKTMNLKEKIYQAMAKQKIYKQNNPRLSENKKQYKCNICKDNYFILNEKSEAVECKCRAGMIMRTRLAKAGISVDEYSRRNINCFPTDRLEAQNMKNLATKFLVEHKKGDSIIYTGKSGTMKTSILMAICLELTTKYNQNHKYFSYRDEMPLLKWQMFNKADEYQKNIKELITCDNLFIDDLFKSGKSATDTKMNTVKIDVSSTDIQIMFQIVNGRYINHKTTLFSSEYKLSQIINEFDEATGTRIYEMCKKYNMYCKDINRRLIK